MIRKIFLLLTLLVGCFSPAPQKPSTLRIGSTLIPQTLDPAKSGDFASATVLYLLYEGLTRYGNHGMAESIEMSEDGLTYRFTLREAVWSDGEPVTAEDFLAGWKKALNPHHPSPSSLLFYPIKNGERIAKELASLEELGVRTDGPRNLIVELEHPTPHFLSVVSLPPFLPIPSHRSETDIQKGAVSNGPYLLLEEDLPSHLSFKKNPLYWNAKDTGCEEIQYQIIPDEQTAMLLFEQGELDWIGGALSPLPPDALTKLSKARAEPVGASTFCAFNTKYEPLSNPAVRRALSSAINREEIVEQLLHSHQIPATRFLPPVLCEGKNRNLFQQDFPDLSNIPPLTLEIRASVTSRLLAQILQSQWEKTLGIRVEIIQSDAKTHIEKLRSGNYQIALANWISFYDDPINLLERFQFETDPKNYSKWSSPEYQNLLKKAQHETDLSKRMKDYEALEDLLAEAVPIAPIYHWTSPMLIQPWVENLEISPCGAVLFEWCKKNPS